MSEMIPFLEGEEVTEENAEPMSNSDPNQNTIEDE